MNLTEELQEQQASKARDPIDGSRFGRPVPAAQLCATSIRLRQNTTDRTTARQPSNATQPTPARESSEPVAMQTGIERLVLQQMSSQRGFVASATAACTALAEQLSAQRVSICWYEDQRCKLVACSQENPASLTPTDRSGIEESMIEAINQQTTISSVNPQGVRRITVSAKLLASRQAGGSGVVINLPLAVDKVAVGAICVEFDTQHAASVIREYDRIISILESLVPVTARLLTLSRALESSVVEQIRKRIFVGFRGSGKVQSNRRRLAWISASITAAFVLLFPFEQSINSDARVQGAAQRIVVAPTDGYLQSVNVHPGDRVTARQALAQLGERELELKRDRLIGEVAQHQADASTAIARGDRSAMAVSRSLANQASAQLSLIQRQLDLSTVRAPIDGVVIDGDLHQSIGSPVDRGQSLFTVAPNDSWRVIIDMDERDISRISNDQIGSLYLSALPWKQVDVIIQRIAPAATTSNNRNVFEVEAHIANPPKELRPGLKGTVRIKAGRQSLIARVTERVRDSAGRVLWRWNPW